MRISWGHALAVIGVTVLVQVANLDRLHLLGELRFDLPLFLLIGLGFAARSHNAAILGFVLGLAVDLFQFGPFGLHAFVFCLVAWSLAEARVRVLQDGASFRTVQGSVAAVVVTSVLWLAGSVFGQSPPPFSTRSVLLVFLTGLIGGIMVHPSTRVAQWMLVERQMARSEAGVSR